MLKIVKQALLTAGCAFILSACADSGKTAVSQSNADKNFAYENIMTRTSVRSYEKRAVSKDTVELLLKAGMQAPSAMKVFPRKFVVVEGEKLEALRDSFPGMAHAPGMENAPLAIVVCGDTAVATDKGTGEFWIQDCSAASENILLAANALGLGSCWTGVYPAPGRAELMAKMLELPSALVPLNAILIGYKGDGVADAQPRWNPSDVIWLK